MKTEKIKVNRLRNFPVERFRDTFGMQYFCNLFACLSEPKVDLWNLFGFEELSFKETRNKFYLKNDKKILVSKVINAEFEDI